MSYVRATFAIGLSCIAVAPVFGQQAVCLERTVPVSLMTRDGSAPPHLNETNFEVTYNKKPIPITTAVMVNGTPRVVLLLDASGSMHGASQVEPDWELVLSVGNEIISEMPRTSPIGLVVFSQKLEYAKTPMVDRTPLKAELNALEKNYEAEVPEPRRTSLWDSLGEGLKMIDHPRLGDAIYVITDGGDNASRVKPKEVAETLGKSGVRLSLLFFKSVCRVLQ